MGAGTRVVDFLAEATDGRRDAPALSAPERTWTYAELDAWAGRRAAELRAEGVRPGQVVPVVLESSVEGITTLLALWRVGAVPAPLNPGLTPAERGRAEAALSGVDPGEAQAILWTSGTEGRPRGVALSAHNLRANARAAAERLDLGPDDTWLASLSLAHVGGLALVVRSLVLGGHMVAAGRFDAATVSALIDGGAGARAAGPLPPGRPLTHVSFVPTQLLRVMDHREGRPPPPTFRCVLLGGAHAPDDLVARAHAEGWPIALTYGMTEMTSQVATASPGLARETPGTVGAPLDGVELRLADEGEILVRGPTRALGYVGSAEVLADEDGWYHTGDLGRVDAAGRLWVTGRRSERIVTGGVTVDALEVEDALRGHPGVADACVVGLFDAEWGELVAAALVPAGPSLDLDALDAWVRERLAPAKRPRRWSLSGELPRNANGKVDRRAVRDALTGGRDT
jgi:O-succinylbenzoic acid--CoA ligase